MSELYRFAFQGLDLRNKTILDAATGAGEATAELARLVAEQGGTSRIVSVDFEFDEKQNARIHERLGPNDRYVELRKADIFDLGFLQPWSIDVVCCDDTLVFLEDRPLHLLSALREFDRVLRPGGSLIITSEGALPRSDDPEREGQWRRWQFAKALWALKGGTWSAEPESGDVARALEQLGYEVFDKKEFPAFKPVGSPKVCIDEWREIMLREIDVLPWPDLREPLRRAAEAVHAKVMSDGFLFSPPYYVLKCRKPGRSPNEGSQR